MAEDRSTGTLPWVLASAVAAISLGLLAASGAAKLVDPDPTTGAMRSAGLPASRSLSITLGVLEVAAGGMGLVVGAVWAAMAALLYGAFSIFTFAAMRKRIPLQSCGCFGREDTPPSYIHVVYNLVATVSLASVAFSGAMPIDWNGSVAEVVLSFSFTFIGVAASYLLLTRLPQVLAMTRSA